MLVFLDLRKHVRYTHSGCNNFTEVEQENDILHSPVKTSVKAGEIN